MSRSTLYIATNPKKGWVKFVSEDSSEEEEEEDEETETETDAYEEEDASDSEEDVEKGKPATGYFHSSL